MAQVSDDVVSSDTATESRNACRTKRELLRDGTEHSSSDSAEFQFVSGHQTSGESLSSLYEKNSENDCWSRAVVSFYRTRAPLFTFFCKDGL